MGVSGPTPARTHTTRSPSDAPPTRAHYTLLTVLLLAIAVVLCADILTVTAVADPLPANGAVLSPINPANITRPYTHSSLRLSSRLTDAAGQPISGARVEILQQIIGNDETKLIGTATTRADGSLTATIPDGPSRLIDLAYPKPETGSYATQAEMRETVTAGLRLRVTPRHTSPTGTVQLEGHVLGILPADGVVVEVLVYYLGQWQPIRTPRTRRDGRLRLDYRFHQATGQFPFRLRVRYGQAGFPYGEACSAWVAVQA